MVALPIDQPTRIVRAPKGEHPYFMMARQTAQDRELSWAARGVLSYLLSKPNHWEVQPTDLQQGCGKDKVYGILKELHEARYLSRKQIHDDKGLIQGWEYQVHEIPFPENTEMDAQPFPAKPDTVNPPLDIKESLENTDSKDSFVPASQSTDETILFPDAPKGFQWVSSSDSTQPLAHLTTGCMTGPLQCKGKMYHRDFYKPGQKLNPRQPCLECLRVAEEKLKPKPKQPKPRPERKPLPWDVLTDSICTHLLGAKDRAGINASAWRAAKIIHGDKSRPEIMGLTDYEYERQKVITLDYAALANEIPRFVKWYRVRCKGCDLKDAGKFMDYWQEWRGKTVSDSSKPKFDPVTATWSKPS